MSSEHSVSAVKNKRVVFVTRSMYWKQGAGLWARTREMLHYLSAITDITVVYLNRVTIEDKHLLNGLKFKHKFIPLGLQRGASNQYIISRFNEVLRDKPIADVYFVDKTELSFIFSAIPACSKKLVDTHDLISERTRKSEAFGIKDNFQLTDEQEKEILKQYDAVICIQKNEFNKVAHWVGQDNVILAPHPVIATNRKLRTEVRTIGFIASRWHANVDGLQWFLKHVWPHVDRAGIELHIYGFVCEAFQNICEPDVRLIGYLDNLEDYYANIDIVINPVRYGAGLKIKTLESIANGLPLVSTEEGINGLETLIGKAFLIGRDSLEFASAINKLIADYDLRKSLGKNGSSYAEDQLTPEQCFGSIAEFIQSH